jgi:regulator of RNase E activity RraA
METAELCDRYEQLYPGAVTDALDERGFGNRVLPSGINALRDSMQMAGIAYPAHGYPDEDCDYDANIRRFLRMLGDAPAHSVAVYQSRDDEAAHLGELSTTALDAQGCRGAVVDGGIRDIRYILDQDFPVFTRYRTPADAPPRWRLSDWNVPVEIGSVEIRPGDVLLGDADGVVCVPRAIREEILYAAEETVETENRVRTAVREGMDPLEAYDKYDEF